MHILYFHQHFSTRQGAAGTRSYEMAQALIRAGHQVTMVCGSYAQGATGLTEDFVNGRRRGIVDGIDVIELKVEYGNDMNFVRRAWAFAKFATASVRIALSEPTDLVFATTTPITAGIPGILARWLRRTPFVFEVRDLWPELPRAMGVISNPILLWLMAALEWISYRSANRLVGLSPGIVEGIAARGTPRERIKMIPNGCDLELFAAHGKPWRPQEVNEGQLLAIFTGTHGHANGLEAVLTAALELKLRGRDDIRIALVGQGGQKSALKEQAQNANLDNVLFIDPIPKEQLINLMAGADLGLQILRDVPAFYHGTSPNKFFDYIAAGLPVLNNYPGWLAQLITENNCGFIVQPDDPEAFADALVLAADDRKGLIEKGKSAKRLAAAAFSREDLSKRWVDWVTSCG